jgi:hypothetical protein
LAGTLATTNGGTGLTVFVANELFYASSTSAMGQSANLAFDGTSTLTVGGANALTFNGATGTITSTATNGNIILTPTGTGTVQIGPVGSGLIQSDAGSSLTVTGTTTLTLNSTTGNLTVGVPVASYVDVAGPTAAQYSTAITSVPTALANVQYVTDAIAAANTSDAPTEVHAVRATVSLAANGTTNIGSLLPAGVTILSVKVSVGVADTAATLVIGKSGGTGTEYMVATENDPQTVGMYMAEDDVDEAGAVQIMATVATTAAVGGATCRVVVMYQKN